MVTNVTSNTNNFCSAQRDMNGDNSVLLFANTDEGYNCKQTVLETRIKELSSNC